jgi:hypothetical protein
VSAATAASAGVDRRLDLVRPRPVAPQAGPDEILPLGDQGRVPQPPVLVGEPHQVALGRRPGRPPGGDQQQQGQQAHRFRLVRHERDDEPGQPHRLGAQVVPHQDLAGRRRVALVEDQVQDREHRAQPVGKLGVAGDAVRDVGGPDLPLGPDDPLAHRRLRHKEGAGDLGRLQAAEQPQGQRHLGRPGERRVAAGEDEAEPVVVHGAHLLGPGVVVLVDPG